MRKNELWRLPYARIMYFDADSFVLRDSVVASSSASSGMLRAARLQRLWRRYRTARFAATGVRAGASSAGAAAAADNATSAATCFNGGFMLLRPDPSTAAALDALEPSVARDRGTEPGTGRRCPGIDQPLLNRAFPHGAWTRVAARDWTTLTHWLASPAFADTCHLPTASALSAHADAVHFFHVLTPWENPHCAACVRGRRPCRAIIARDLECRVQGVANQLWWSELLEETSPDVRRVCLARTEQQLRDEHAAQPAAASSLELRAGMCNGCARRPTPACELPRYPTEVPSSAAVVSQRDALASLYASAGGAHWRMRQRWLRGSPCRWQGIECEHGDVTSVDLGGNGAVGTLPTELCSLSKLRVLNIDESRLSGTLPGGLHALSSLRTILLASNARLSGTIPNLGRLRSLTELDVSRTRLSGSLGHDIAALAHLQRLQLDHIAISGTVPTALGRLTRAEALFMHENPALSGTVPTQIGQLAASLHLGMSFASTLVSGSIPTELGSATRLRAMWLVHTRLSGTVPTQLGAMHLAELELHVNRLSGTLPAQLGHGPMGAALRRCVLTATQGPFQAHHSMRPRDRLEADSNRFACPLPASLPAPCVPHLRCAADEGGMRGHGKLMAGDDAEDAREHRARAASRAGRAGRGRGRAARLALG